MTAAEPPEFLTLEEVLERYRLTRTALMKLVNEGSFPPALRVTRRKILFRASDVTKWENGRWLYPGDVYARAEAVRDSIRQPPSLRLRRRRDDQTTSPEPVPDAR